MKKYMNILHIGLLSHFTEGMLYQDNILSDMNVKEGNRVTFITDTYCYISGKLVSVPEDDKILANGMRLIRVKYDKIINRAITEKIQKARSLKKLLQEIQPDSILYHGACGYELMDIAEYVKVHSNVLFYIDSHEDFNNTAKTLFAKIFYKYIHGVFIKKALPYVNKFFYITLETKNYLKEMYRLDDSILEYYPLGGIIIPINEQKKTRQYLIEKYDLPEDVIICAHSGKLVKEKKTEELLKAFINVNNKRLHIFVFGSIPDYQKDVLMPLIEKDNRIHFLSWINDNEIKKILSATDLYCQPGTQSATMQCALCSGCSVMVYPYKSHQYLLQKECFYVKNSLDIQEVFINILENEAQLKKIKKNSFELAQEKLDYQLLARRICS